MKIKYIIKEQQKPKGENRITNNSTFQGIQRGATTVRRTLEDTIG